LVIGAWSLVIPEFIDTEKIEERFSSRFPLFYPGIDAAWSHFGRTSGLFANNEEES
jgi:hypothetical protein